MSFRQILRVEALMASTIWRGFITFGLVSVPVRLFRAARAERVSLKRLYRADGPVSSRAHSEDEETEEAPPPRPVKGRKNLESAIPGTSSAHSRFTVAVDVPSSSPEPVLAP